MLKPSQRSNLSKSKPQLFKGQRSIHHRRSQSGFTLIESLIALMVAAILLTATAPMIMLAVASRVQSRRVNLATQAAWSYIDGIKSGVIAVPAQTGADFSQANFAIAAPTSLPGTDNTDPGRVDTNSNGFTVAEPQDLVVQAFRNGPTDAAQAKQQGYVVGIRVYRADAFNGSSPTQTSQAPTVFTGTNGSKNHPLVVIKTEIGTQATFNDYRDRLSNP
jgi:prepilin-type N-terminal cleavage/methylation domain-containing protein